MFNSTTHLILDHEGRIVAVLVGRPRDDPSWQNTVDGAAATMERVRVDGQAIPVQKPDGTEEIKYGWEDRDKGRRGLYTSISTGASFGQGQTVRVFSIIISTLR